MNYYEYNDTKSTQYPLLEFDYEAMLVDHTDLSDDELAAFQSLLEKTYATKPLGDPASLHSEQH